MRVLFRRVLSIPLAHHTAPGRCETQPGNSAGWQHSQRAERQLATALAGTCATNHTARAQEDATASSS